MRLRGRWLCCLCVGISVILCSIVLSHGSAPAPPAYPLKASANSRYLVDQTNVPFLLVGDSPQALIVNLTEAEAGMFFANRAAYGFNTVWINLLCAQGTGGREDGSTIDGILPFTTPGDLATPNEAYFAHVDRILALAAQSGLQVLLDPAETISWLSVLRANGATKARAYGQYLGTRYKTTDNLLWMSGNDFQTWSTSADDALVRAVALGIKDVDTRHLHTVELNYSVSNSLDDPTWAPIIGFNAAYTYNATYAEVLHGYNLSPPIPVFLVEANYEGENSQSYLTTPEVVRRQAYWTMLSGATGQLYGHRYTWQFLPGWQANLDTLGTLHMQYMHALFAAYPWYDLIPDQTHAVVTAGSGFFTDGCCVNDNDYATTARTPDGALVMVYLPSRRTLTVNLATLSAPATARWYDPTTGGYTLIVGPTNGLFPNVGTTTLTPPGNNSGGDGDWVLVLATGAAPPSPVTHNLVVTKTGTGTGTVTSIPSGVSCGSTCNASFAEGSQVTLTAAAAGGSAFTGWSGSGCGGVGTCVVTMSATQGVTATFTVQPSQTTYVLTVTKTGTGSGTVASVPAGVTCGTTCTASFNSGTVVTLTATAAGGSAFSGWTGGGCSGTNPCAVTMSVAQGVTASFALAPVGSGLVAAYNFNEGSGSIVVDVSGRGHTGTINGATWTTSGKAGNALNFNGTNARVTVPSANDLNLTSAMTLEAWVYPTAAQSNWRTILHKEVDRYYLMASSNQNTPAVGGTFTAGNRNTYAPSALPVNTWSHLAATFDGSMVRLFVNGNQVASQAQSTALTTSTGPLSIGGTAAYGEYFQGRIDDVRVYNRALSTSELQVDMNTPLGGSTPSPTTYTLTVTKSGTGIGTVGSIPAGITCGATCSASFPDSTSVSLTAVPAVGSTFTGWSGAGCSGTGACTVTVTGAMRVTATFRRFR